jgi:hypothetical protein
MKDNHIDVFGIAETFLNNDEQVLINGYKWIGKNRQIIGKTGRLKEGVVLVC